MSYSDSMYKTDKGTLLKIVLRMFIKPIFHSGNFPPQLNIVIM